MEPQPRTHFLYIDEAGNFDFSPKGSKYLILTCAVMRRPFEHIGSLAEIKYDCLEGRLDDKHGKNYHEFHAANDWQNLRNKVFAVISGIPELAVYSVIIRKNKANPTIRNPERIYSMAFKWLIEDVRRGEGIGNMDFAVVVSDSINFKGKNDVLKAALVHHLENEFKFNGIEYVLYQHASCSDFNLQVVDYCSWAVQRKWEKGDSRSYSLLSASIKRQSDIFRNGDTEYYNFER